MSYHADDYWLVDREDIRQYMDDDGFLDITSDREPDWGEQI